MQSSNDYAILHIYQAEFHPKVLYCPFYRSASESFGKTKPLKKVYFLVVRKLKKKY